MWHHRALLSLWTIAFVVSAAGAEETSEVEGSVTLPLPEYLELVERVEEHERESRAEAEIAVAVLASQQTSIRVTEGLAEIGLAEIETVFQLELSGTPTGSVALPFSGMVEEAAVEPRSGASLDRDEKSVVFYAPRPGSYTVTVRGRRELEGDGGVYRLPLAASPAPVAAIEIELPAQQEWSCEGAVLVKEELHEAHRLVKLAPARGVEHVLEIRRRTLGLEEERALVRSTVVTLVEVQATGLDGARYGTLTRQDVVLYEVLRGELGTFEVILPAEVELQRVATDEGDAFPVVDGRRLSVKRDRRLAGTGHLVVAYRPRPLDAGTVPLPSLDPKIAPQARYLVMASAVAAQVRPRPEKSWRQVDLEDLPERLRQEIEPLSPNAVWRLTDESREPRLAAKPLPEAERVEGVVWQRHTTTLLSVDGALVHRDRFVVETKGTAFAVRLPPGAVLWSAQVDDLAVRPFEHPASDGGNTGPVILVPLAFRSQGRATVELVTVEERAIERGRSKIRLETLRVKEPVVRHEWRLLLPESHRYRVARGDLRAVVEPGEIRSARDSSGSVGYAEPERIPSARQRAILPHPIPGFSGMVVDTEDSPLPGVTVTVEGTTDQIRITDVRGHFGFPNLPGGVYRVKAELDGFSSVEYPKITVPEGRSTQIGITMSPAVEETITVTSETPLLDRRRIHVNVREIESRRKRELASRELDHLRSGLVGGVKPLKVEIPESGKLLVLSGVLPPARVGLELDVRAK